MRKKIPRKKREVGFEHGHAEHSAHTSQYVNLSSWNSRTVESQPVEFFSAGRFDFPHRRTECALSPGVKQHSPFCFNSHLCSAALKHWPNSVPCRQPPQRREADRAAHSARRCKSKSQTSNGLRFAQPKRLKRSRTASAFVTPLPKPPQRARSRAASARTAQPSQEAEPTLPNLSSSWEPKATATNAGMPLNCTKTRMRPAPPKKSSPAVAQLRPEAARIRKWPANA